MKVELSGKILTEQSILPTPGSSFSDAAETARALTDRQLNALRYVHGHIKEHGYPPTLREIGKHMGITSTNGVNDHLRALERKGYIHRTDQLSRGIRLTVKGLGAVGDVASRDSITSMAEDDLRARVIRCRQILIRVLSLLNHVAPSSPLIAELQKEIAP